MNNKILIVVILAVTTLLLASHVMAQDELSPMEELGMKLYFDENLSQPAGQSCASCHHPDFGFVDPDNDLPVSAGVLPGRFGGRNSPSSAYAMYAPTFHFDEVEGLYVGGQFWDGRATGLVLGDPLADQALGPFLNPVEMNNKVKRVVKEVAKSEYADLFEVVWGPGSLDDIDAAYDRIALSIAAFERTELFAPFSSKYDHYLKTCLAAGGDMNDCAQGIGVTAETVGMSVFTVEEWDGLQLFMGVNNNDNILEVGEGAMCAACHVAEWTADPGNVVVPDWSPDGSIPPVFTDFTFDNLGVPKSTHPLLVDNEVDLGLGPIVGDELENGKFKVMSLRNIGLTAPYAHNGFFLTLKDITHFYNTRDVEVFPAPEYPDTINIDELGQLGLSDANEDALVAFMMTLSDGYEPPVP